jgi:hypothetical protein
MSTVDHTNNGSPTIVVGWDGSAAARGAIAAAARIALGGTVIAVHHQRRPRQRVGRAAAHRRRPRPRHPTAVNHLQEA